MTGSVIIRHGHQIKDGLIDYDDRPISWEEADQKAGRRLDRRKAWAFIDDRLCELIRFTTRCSGCSECPGEDRGMGCSECGYHGVVRQGHWIPAS
jgi:hypothetical protein